MFISRCLVLVSMAAHALTGSEQYLYETLRGGEQPSSDDVCIAIDGGLMVGIGGSPSEMEFCSVASIGETNARFSSSAQSTCGVFGLFSTSSTRRGSALGSRGNV